MIEEREKIVIGSFLGLLLALLVIIIMPPLSQEATYSSDSFRIVPISAEDLTKGSSDQIIDIVQPDLSYQLQSPILINLALTLASAVFISFVLSLSIKTKLK
ncbi:MAG: hypothetical protein ACPLY9_03190 [Nitrososphaerales archaeon]